MSNSAYPIGSIHRGYDLSESVPTEDGDERKGWPRRFLIGCFWMLVVEIGTGIIGWLIRELCR
jgi:hypothetical protein